MRFIQRVLKRISCLWGSNPVTPGIRLPPTPVIEFLCFTNRQIPGTYVDDYPYKIVIKINGKKRTATGDKCRLLTQTDFNKIFTELTGEPTVLKASTKYRFVLSEAFIRKGGNEFLKARIPGS